MKIETTQDSSQTLYSPQFDQTYHSRYGAITESQHVFIQNGLHQKMKDTKTISIFEMGLGTGLNALLTWQEAKNHQLTIDYTAIEKYPIESTLLKEYKLPNSELQNDFTVISSLSWNVQAELERFNFKKIIQDLCEYKTDKHFDLIYFDAFSPNAQPELWTQEVLSKIYQWLHPQGILVTYCAKGSFKRTLKSIGFQVESPQGPFGKREITRAIKPDIKPII